MKRSLIFVFTVFCLLGMVSQSVYAEKVTSGQVELVVYGWLSSDACPMGMALNSDIAKIDKYENKGCPFFAVYLEQGGLIIVSGDDRIEPVIAFLDDAYAELDDFSPLFSFVSKDVSARFGALKFVDGGVGTDAATKAGGGLSTLSAVEKWDVLTCLSPEYTCKAGYQTNISDVRVSPLLATKWSQQSYNNIVGGLTCYNYYTPNNYPSGCVATAMAQLIKFWQYPQTAVSGSNTIYVDGSSQVKSIMGGSLPGGGYDFSLMPDNPALGVTLAQRQEIGRLCSDTGVAVGMSYYSAGSSASLSDGASSLRSIFGFADTKYVADDIALSGGLLNVLNPNLDAGQPLIMGILNSSLYTGHAVVVDGYGYNFGTMYHHLNMGWAGYADLWYNLPTISYGSQNYDLVTDCIYNISPSTTGEIISGRLTDSFGNPLGNVTITATDGSNSYTAVTNYSGIYAFTGMASNTEYVLTGDNSQFAIPMYIMSIHTATGQSGVYDDVSGNVWLEDMIAYQMPCMPEAIDKEIKTTTLSSVVITLEADDDGYVDPVVTGSPWFVITRLPAEGHLAEPGGQAITSVPYRLSNTSNQVVYSNMIGLEGLDDFGFQACDHMGFGSGQVDIVMLSMDQDFENWPRPGWSFYDGNIPQNGSSWNFYNITSTPKSVWTGTISALCISYNGSSPNDSLVYSPIDTNLFPQGFRLSFDHMFRTYYPGVSLGIVEISIDGMNWIGLPGGTFYSNADGRVDIDVLPAVIPGIFGAPNVRVRWRYSASNDMYWGIDNVSILNLELPMDRMADIDNDRDIDMQDLQLLSSDWLSAAPIYNTNIYSSDPEVNLLDFTILADNWLSLP